MATLSQHYDTNFDVNPYYVPINKQLSPMYDKSKKTWSQRLKITKSEKSTAPMVVQQLPPPPQQLQLSEYSAGIDYPPSALSRSMKYAEPWIYGTVRGIPARPMHFLPGQAMFAPMPSEIAVVICSCPEYLNGTKRDVKKASVCKKCKGSRLPLAPIGGTVRIRPTSAPLQQKLRPTTASTLRVVSSKSRPSILDPQRDPYDLMRRTRLLSPEPKCSTPQPEKSYRSSRGKSSSPNRSRSRTPRSQLEESGKSSPKPNPVKTERWIVDDGIQSAKETNHRRSILRCNVNPYDLISNKSSSSSSSSVQHLSEFSPNQHDDDDDDVVVDIFGVTTSNTINQRTAISRKATGPGTVSSPSPSTASSSTTTGSRCSTPQSSTYTSSGSPNTSSKTMNYANVKAIAGQRISFGENTSSSSLITQKGDSFSYENVPSVPLSGEAASGSPKLQKQQSSAKKDDNPIQTKATTNQPKRPPRRKNDTNPSPGGSSDDNDNSVVTAANPSNEQHFQVPSPTSTDPPAAAASQRPSIKSILKRPPPSSAPTGTSPKSPSNGDTDAGSPDVSVDNACRFDHHHHRQQQHHHQIKRNSGRTHEIPAKSPASAGSGTFPAVGVDTKLPKSTSERKTAAETKNGSQFYIPLPQARKKVQFMVEDKIIRVEHTAIAPQRDGEVNVDNDNDNCNDDDDDEDDYHSAQGDDDDRSEISKQISKLRTANNQDGSASRSRSTANNAANSNLSQDHANEDGHRICENKVSSNVADVTRNPKDNKVSPSVAPATAMANRRSQEQQQHIQRRHQVHIQQQQQEAILNQLQQESNLVSSEMLNPPRSGGYYQNLLHHQHQRQDHRQDEPHYEDVADEHVDDDNEDKDDDEDDEEDVNRTEDQDEDEDDRQTVVLADEGSITDSVNGQPRTEDPRSETVTKATTALTTTASPTSGALSRNAIRRTHSERQPCNVNIGTSSTNVILNFKDTMALRMKATRKDSREVFSSIGNGSNSSCGVGTQQSVGLFRPKEPPPPPPTQGGMANHGNHHQHQQQQQQHQLRLSNTQTNVTAKETPPTFVAGAGGSSKTQTILITATKEDRDDKRTNSYDIVDDAKEDIAAKNNDTNCQQREHPTSNRRLSVSRSGLDEQKHPPNKADDTSQRRISSSSYQDRATTKNIYETFDSFTQADPPSPAPPPLAALKTQASPKYTFGSTSQPNRTVVRVAPFNKTSSEVHRLKITHTDDDTKTSGGRNSSNGAGSQKKTSILITGDDCYSTVNVTNDTPLYQSSVVVADGSSSDPMLKVTSNTVTINVVNSSPRTPEEELIYKNNKINTLLSRGATRAIIPIGGGLSSTNLPDPLKTTPKRGRTLITLDYEQSPSPVSDIPSEALTPSPSCENGESDDVFCHEEELVKILRNPVEAVRRNLVPHICGKADSTASSQNSDAESKSSKRHRKRPTNNELTVPNASVGGSGERHSFVSKLLEDPTLSQLADGLESDVVVKLIENSLRRLQESRSSIDTSGTKDNEDMDRLINTSLQRIKEERQKLEMNSQKVTPDADEMQEIQSNRGSISSGNSFSSANYEMFDYSDNNESDCYQSCSSEIAPDVDTPLETRSKFYQMLVDATLAEIEISMNVEEDHHYESIRGVGGSNNGDPIYEEITDIPPPLPLSPPPLNDPELEKKAARSMFEGASKYDILSYLVDAKERGLVREESFEYNINNMSNPIIIEEENDTLSDLKQISDMSSRISHLSVTSDSSEDTTSLTGSMVNERLSVISALRKGTSSDIERNDSGVGSETSKSSRSKYQNNLQAGSVLSKISPIHLCEDCDGPVETQVTDSGVMFAPLVCRKCGKKRAERKEIITEIVETEEKYGRDLQIILEEFCQPMLVAGLLTQEQLSAIFLNTEELLENNQTLAERMRDALDIALEQGDDDLLTVNIGKIFLEFTQMLHAFESYCVRQAGASLLLANLEKEKELLRIFLKVSQMENTVLRRMNLNSFLMVPVQRVTKYPLLLARLYKVTPSHLDGRDLLKQAQEKIELHLTHINQEAKDVPTKLWRRISSSSPNRRASCEIDMINIKLRKMAIDILEWNHDEVRFAMEGRLLYTQPTDSNWKKARTIKLNPVNALLVTNGKPSANYKAEKAVSDHPNFPKHTGIREASLLVVKEKCGRYTLIREPLYLDRCIVCTEADWDEYFELQEISSKDTFIFKAEDGVRTKQWYTQLQYHAQGMGAWRKRRNALANIMINGMLSRT